MIWWLRVRMNLTLHRTALQSVRNGADVVTPFYSWHKGFAHRFSGAGYMRNLRRSTWAYSIGASWDSWMRNRHLSILTWPGSVLHMAGEMQRLCTLLTRTGGYHSFAMEPMSFIWALTATENRCVKFVANANQIMVLSWLWKLTWLYKLLVNYEIASHFPVCVSKAMLV
jgi:hypothetical protein